MSLLDQKIAVAGRSSDITETADERILGISFFSGTAREAIEHFRKAGGLLVAPASPGLLKLYYDEEYRRALQQADLAIADSELLVLVWKLVTGRKLNKISGISYLRSLLDGGISKNDAVFWVVSSDLAKKRAFKWLAAHGFQSEEEDFYVASLQEKTEDYALLLQIEKRKPRDVVIATVAGAQEKLGLYLRDYLHCQPRPNIHCLGAALGFLTGDQPPISDWADRHNLGWLPRLFSQPRLLIPRIGIAFALIGMVLKYRSELPPLRSRWTEL